MMATFIPQLIVPELLDASLQAAAVGGDKFVNSGREFLLIQNPNPAPEGNLTLTITPGQTFDGLSLEDLEVVVVANTRAFVGPFPICPYNDAGGVVTLSWSHVVNVEVALLVLRGY